MIGTHTDRDGRVMLIAEMDNKHLANMIRLLCRDLARTRQQLTEAQTSAQQILEAQRNSSQLTLQQRLERRVYGRPEVKEAELVARMEEAEKAAALLVQGLMLKLMPYVAEAFIRPDLAGGALSADVAKAIGRAGPLPKEPSLLAMRQQGTQAVHIIRVGPQTSKLFDEDPDLSDDMEEWLRDPEEGDR